MRLARTLSASEAVRLTRFIFKSNICGARAFFDALLIIFSQVFADAQALLSPATTKAIDAKKSASDSKASENNSAKDDSAAANAPSTSVVAPSRLTLEAATD